MYQRIKNERDLLHVQVGSILIQYPLSGRTSDELDLSSPDAFELYEVQEKETDIIRLLQRPNIESDYTMNSQSPDASAAGVLTKFIVKHTDTLVLEENWWREDY